MDGFRKVRRGVPVRLDQLTVHLRARSPWEAVELGTALVRRHAAAIWKPWLLLGLPLFALCNLAAWALDAMWLAALAMWWLKPAFDRIPLYVISRATFGSVPGLGETLRAQFSWGWKPLLHYLSWRRFGFARALYLPIELLEGDGGARLRERRRVLGGTVYGNAALLGATCLHFEAALNLGAIAGLMMFVPVDELPEAVRAGWALIGEQTPGWAALGFNAIAWLATSLIEPFYVGAGFGLYRNRRTQIEAWDVEIAFRRLRERLRVPAANFALLLAVATMFAGPARAQDSDPLPRNATAMQVQQDDATPAEGGKKNDAATPASVFGAQRVDPARFGQAVDRAYADPLLSGKRKQTTWTRRRGFESPDSRPAPDNSWMQAVARLFALIGEWGLWIIAGILLLVLLATAPRWWPWMRGGLRRRQGVDAAAVEVEALPLPDALPENVAAAARRLWREGRPRHALALLYRASVDSMCVRAGVVLPPGATESECLRASRRMPDADDRSLFARMVRLWQYAAYARRLPADDEFEALIGQLQQRYGWPA